MDREELINAIAEVVDLTVSVLHRNQEGKLKHVLLPLVTMVAVEPIEIGA
jgi:hypothetical protein